MASKPPPLLTLRDFEALVGDRFVFSLEGVEQSAEGELESAESLGPGARRPGVEREPFRLCFRFPAGSNLGQCTFHVSHPRLEPTSMLIVPVGEDDAGWYMEAIYN